MTMTTRDPSTEVGTTQAIRAEIDAVIETAGKVAHEGLAPDADGVRVLAGLVLQLAEQVGRLVDGASERPTTDRSPNETDAPIEEDVTPEDAPADPPREI
jgi:hypothetical protein